MDGGISMNGEICIDDDAGEMQWKRVSMDDDDGAAKIRLSLPRWDLQTLINAEKQRFKELVFVRVKLA